MKTTINAKRILIIDDDAAMLRALSKVLSGEGAIVTSASWAGEAMQHLTKDLEQFDLIITDIRMPILGGQTILGAVAVALPHVPVIVMTAFGTQELKDECLRRGAAAFLEKPLDTPQFLQVIESAFSSPKLSSKRRARRGSGVRKANAPTSENKTDVFSRTGELLHGIGS